MQIAAAPSQMAREIAEIPHAVQRLIDESLAACLALGRALRADPPPAFITCARGTSDQAALYFKYLVETGAGIPVASLGPSVASIYGATLRAQDMVCLTISQSGGSPDLADLQAAVERGGGRTVALLNTLASPVGEGAQTVIDLQAGEERAVAATKTFVCSLVALAGITGGLTGDEDLIGRLAALPGVLDAALAADPRHDLAVLATAPSVLVISRGPTMAAAGEAALKLMETCQLHAHAFSAAEVMHGPAVLAEQGVAAMGFVPEDQGRASVARAQAALQAAGSPFVDIGSEPAVIAVPPAGHPALAPIVQVTAFYRLVEALSRRLGLDPDHPPGLRKITKTT